MSDKELIEIIEQTKDDETGAFWRRYEEWKIRRATLVPYTPPHLVPKRKISNHTEETLQDIINDSDAKITAALAKCELPDRRWISPQGRERSNIRQWMHEHVDARAELEELQNQRGCRVLYADRYPRFLNVPCLFGTAYLFIDKGWQEQSVITSGTSKDRDCCYLINAHDDHDRLFPLNKHPLRQPDPVKIRCIRWGTIVHRSNPVEPYQRAVNLNRIFLDRKGEERDSIQLNASDLLYPPVILPNYEHHQRFIQEFNDALFLFPGFSGLVEEYLIEMRLKIACDNTLFVLENTK